MPEFDIEPVGGGGGGGGKRGFRLDRKTVWLFAVAATVALALLTVLMRRREPQEVVIDYGSYADVPVSGAPQVTPSMIEQLRLETATQMQALAVAMEEARQEQEARMAQLVSSSIESVASSIERLQVQWDQRTQQIAQELERRIVDVETRAVLSDRAQNPAMTVDPTQDIVNRIKEITALGQSLTLAGKGSSPEIKQLHQEKVELAAKLGYIVTPEGYVYDPKTNRKVEELSPKPIPTGATK